jgi:hypothetical protein
MKYRGVNIKAVRYNKTVHLSDRTFEPVKTTWDKGWSPCGVDYPMTLEEAKESVDTLIDGVMKGCGCTEKEAVKLLNEK